MTTLHTKAYKLLQIIAYQERPNQCINDGDRTRVALRSGPDTGDECGQRTVVRGQRQAKVTYDDTLEREMTAMTEEVSHDLAAEAEVAALGDRSLTKW